MSLEAYLLLLLVLATCLTGWRVTTLLTRITILLEARSARLRNADERTP